MNFPKCSKRPLTPPTPSISENHVAIFYNFISSNLQNLKIISADSFFIKYTYNGASQGCSLVLLVPPFIVVIKLSSHAERCFYWGSVLLIVIMTKLRVGLLVEFLSLLL